MRVFIPYDYEVKNFDVRALNITINICTETELIKFNKMKYFSDCFHLFRFLCRATNYEANYIKIIFIRYTQFTIPIICLNFKILLS